MQQPSQSVDGGAAVLSNPFTPRSSGRFAPASSAINGILSQSQAAEPHDPDAISREIASAIESVQLASPLQTTGTHVDASSPGSPGVFVLRMPPSEMQMRAQAAKQQQQQQQQQQQHQQHQRASPTNDSSFAFSDVPSLADFDIPAIASDPALHAK